jgi:hypothetical protein
VVSGYVWEEVRHNKGRGDERYLMPRLKARIAKTSAKSGETCLQCGG